MEYGCLILFTQHKEMIKYGPSIDLLLLFHLLEDGVEVLGEVSGVYLDGHCMVSLQFPSQLDHSFFSVHNQLLQILIAQFFPGPTLPGTLTTAF